MLSVEGGLFDALDSLANAETPQDSGCPGEYEFRLPQDINNEMGEGQPGEEGRPPRKEAAEWKIFIYYDFFYVCVEIFQIIEIARVSWLVTDLMELSIIFD